MSTEHNALYEATDLLYLLCVYNKVNWQLVGRLLRLVYSKIGPRERAPCPPGLTVPSAKSA